MRNPCVKTARMVILVLRSPLDHHSITVAYLQAAATDRFGGDQRRVLGTVRGTPRGFGRLSTKQWGFNQERWVMNCCAKERWVLKFHEEWEDCKYDLQVSFIAITYYIIYIYMCVYGIRQASHNDDLVIYDAASFQGSMDLAEAFDWVYTPVSTGNLGASGRPHLKDFVW